MITHLADRLQKNDRGKTWRNRKKKEKERKREKRERKVKG